MTGKIRGTAGRRQCAQHHNAENTDAQAVDNALHHARRERSTAGQPRAGTRRGARDEERPGELSEPQRKQHEEHEAHRGRRVHAGKADVPEGLEEETPPNRPDQMDDQQKAQIGEQGPRVGVANGGEDGAGVGMAERNEDERSAHHQRERATRTANLRARISLS